MTLTRDDAGLRKSSALLAAWRVVTTLGLPAIQGLLQLRLLGGKEHAVRIDERRGLASLQRPDGPLLWVHAASIGEAQSMLVLIDRLLREWSDVNILMTTGTVTSGEMMSERLPRRAMHQFVPVDRPAWVRRFLDYWRPDLAMWVESELWPNLVADTRERGTPMVLVNARMSARSHRGWKRAPGFAKRLLGCFDLVLAQDETIAERLWDLGAIRVEVPGNLKSAAAPLPATAGELIAMQDAFGNRPLWLAASTHAPEESIAAQCHAGLSDRIPGLLTVIAPRHPRRADEIASDLRRKGLTVARHSRGDICAPETDVYLADATGIMGVLYRIAPIAFVGGSLLPHGGQNLLEPARLDCAILHGPHVDNFRAVAHELAAADAAVEVADGAALTATLARLLADPVQVSHMAQAARAVADRRQDVLDRVVNALTPLIDRATAGR